MNYGTIFECDGKRAIRHRVPEAEWVTVCGLDLYNKMPEEWGPIPPTSLKAGWNIEPGDRTETRCKKCYPNQRKAKRSWQTKK